MRWQFFDAVQAQVERHSGVEVGHKHSHLVQERVEVGDSRLGEDGVDLGRLCQEEDTGSLHGWDPRRRRRRVSNSGRKHSNCRTLNLPDTGRVEDTGHSTGVVAGTGHSVDHRHMHAGAPGPAWDMHSSHRGAGLWPATLAGSRYHDQSPPAVGMSSCHHEAVHPWALTAGSSHRDLDRLEEDSDCAGGPGRPTCWLEDGEGSPW